MTLKPVRIREKNAEEWKVIGAVQSDTFIAVIRDPAKHGFRGGAATWTDACNAKSAAWGLDLKVMEDLASKGVRYVEIPTTTGKRYRTTMETLLGPKSFVHEFAGHRRQTFLNLEFWTRV